MLCFASENNMNLLFKFAVAVLQKITPPFCTCLAFGLAFPFGLGFWMGDYGGFGKINKNTNNNHCDICVGLSFWRARLLK